MPATRTAEAPKTAMPEIEFRGASEIVPADAPTQAVALAPEAATIFQIIERAARDQSVDIDKMERLILMQERVQSRSAEVEFDNAMSDAQQEMQAVRVDANNPQTKSKYASYHALDAAIRPIYAKHGFSLSFDTADGAGQDCIRIVCKVAHRGGHRERPRIDMPADGKGAKGGDVMTKTHAAGSAITYGKRYLLSMIFNVAVSQDDDGNAASGKYPGMSGGGTEFRPDGPRRFQGNGPTSDWVGDAKRDGIVDETRTKGTLPGKAATPAASAVKRVEWCKNAVEGFKMAQTKDELLGWWKTEAERLGVIEEAMPAEYERLLAAYDAAIERTAARVG